jgi:hypothetical protein
MSFLLSSRRWLERDGAQATSFCALDTFGCPIRIEIDPLGGEQFKKGQKIFKRPASSS